MGAEAQEFKISSAAFLGSLEGSWMACADEVPQCLLITRVSISSSLMTVDFAGHSTRGWICFSFETFTISSDSLLDSKVSADPFVPCGELLAELLNGPLVYSLRFTPGYTYEKYSGGLLFPPSYVPVIMSDDNRLHPLN
ncbi:UDP-glucuronosyltransferase 2B14-like isoform X2 [Lepus europaeus]|uniref:UDP-glucuronosyltransferase 2B14-like isoform X2 n=1 Tax=Lepus europaeus TaxID=9983 RepID=UPI002B48DCB4|nr:UDP-glucuronosyltransferase 2B14-like isoform X2 [Lepus europaeus]